MSLFHITDPDQITSLPAFEDHEPIAVNLLVSGGNARFPQQCKPKLLIVCSSNHSLFLDLERVEPHALLVPLLGSTPTEMICAHAKPVVKQILFHYGMVPRDLFCCRLAMELLGQGNRLASVEVRRLGQGVLDSDACGEVLAQHLDETGMLAYAEQMTRLLRFALDLRERLGSLKLRKVSRLEFRTVVPVAAMELKGIRLDQEAWEEAARQFKEKRMMLEQAVSAELETSDGLPGMDVINLQSPEQVRQALHAKGILVADTSEARLKPLAAEYPFVRDLLAFRHVHRILSATVTPFREAILPETGRIHAQYHQIASASGRFACSDPSIQQVPREKEIRRCFRPASGYRYIVADYSQVELRVAAGFSRDPLMLEAYREGRDLHRLTAALTMGKREEQVTNQERQAAKAINFGLIYAMGSRGLRQSAQQSYGVDMSQQEADTFHRRFFESYRGIQQWQRSTQENGRRQGYIRTAAGRIRSYHQENLRVTELLNIPIQGTAAEGLKSAMCIFWDKVQETEIDAHVVAIIHDEIIVEVSEQMAEQALGMLCEAMVAGMTWLVPGMTFEVDAAIVDSWAEK